MQLCCTHLIGDTLDNYGAHSYFLLPEQHFSPQLRQQHLCGLSQAALCDRVGEPAAGAAHFQWRTAARRLGCPVLVWLVFWLCSTRAHLDSTHPTERPWSIERGRGAQPHGSYVATLCHLLGHSLGAPLPVWGPFQHLFYCGARWHLGTLLHWSLWAALPAVPAHAGPGA